MYKNLRLQLNWTCKSSVVNFTQNNQHWKLTPCILRRQFLCTFVLRSPTMCVFSCDIMVDVVFWHRIGNNSFIYIAHFQQTYGPLAHNNQPTGSIAWCQAQSLCRDSKVGYAIFLHWRLYRTACCFSSAANQIRASEIWGDGNIPKYI